MYFLREQFCSRHSVNFNMITDFVIYDGVSIPIMECNLHVIKCRLW